MKYYHGRRNHAAGVNFTLCQLRDFGSSPHVRRSGSWIINVIIAREDQQTSLSDYGVTSENKSSPSDPSPEQPKILHLLSTLFKDKENHDKKGGSTFSLSCSALRDGLLPLSLILSFSWQICLPSLCLSFFCTSRLPVSTFLN